MFYEASPSFRDRYYAAMASSYGDVAIQEKGDLAEQRVGLVDVHRQPRRGACPNFCVNGVSFNS